MALVNEGNFYYGFVEVGERKFTFVLTLTAEHEETRQKEPPQGSQGLFQVDWRLYEELGSSLKNFCKNKRFLDPRDLYNQFSDFVNVNVKTFKTKKWYKEPLKMAVLAKNLAKEMDSVKNFIKSFDLETQIMEIEVTDSQSRIHKAVLQLSINYKNDPLIILNHDLPLHKAEKYSNFQLHNILCVSEFCVKFSELVDCFQQFWNAIGIIDSECWVLDPLNPTFKDVNRRLKLSETVSVILTFNPFCVYQRPKIKLLGCQADVNHYESILQKNLEDDVWDNEESLLFNLSNVLEVSLPSRAFCEDAEEMDLGEAGECAICFTKQLDNAVPDEMCENPNCKSIYHSICLFTYLSSVPRNRDFFGKIQGECPNCDALISCTIPR